jgi:PEP-CTERM motif
MKAFSITTLAILCALAIPAQGNSIAITYSLTGGPIAEPVVSGTTLILDGLFTGSILSSDPGLNVPWNPVTYSDHSVIDLTTGILNGTFDIVFADGDTLFGNVFEDVSAVVATGTGPFTQTLTFIGGTGEFAGATGSASGAGLAGGTVSGSGLLNAPAVPEPASVALLLFGLAVISASWRLKGKSYAGSRP